MGNLSSLLIGLIASAPSKILASLGMGFISFAAYAAVGDLLISQIQSSWSGMGTDIISYLSLAGFGTGIGVILGCIVTRLSLTQLSTLGKLGQ